MRERMTSLPDTGLGTDRPEQRKGNTHRAQGEDQTVRPRVPAERDESADQQAGHDETLHAKAELARRDLERGLTDTSKGAELDATYDRLRADLPNGDKQFRP